MVIDNENLVDAGAKGTKILVARCPIRYQTP